MSWKIHKNNIYMCKNMSVASVSLTPRCLDIWQTHNNQQQRHIWKDVQISKTASWHWYWNGFYGLHSPADGCHRVWCRRCPFEWATERRMECVAGSKVYCVFLRLYHSGCSSQEESHLACLQTSKPGWNLCGVTWICFHCVRLAHVDMFPWFLISLCDAAPVDPHWCVFFCFVFLNLSLLCLVISHGFIRAEAWTVVPP